MLCVAAANPPDSDASEGLFLPLPSFFEIALDVVQLSEGIGGEGADEKGKNGPRFVGML